ncbi:MAG: tripartite tricarboxylate transporter TctB family protein [Pseudomonadota bacterium]
MTTASRLQHTIASGIVAVVGIWVAWISYTQEPAEAFFFPRLIATVFVVLALWTFGKAVLGLSKAGEGVSLGDLRNFLPGVVIAAIYVFWAAKAFGFYTATAVAFFVLYAIYDPAPHTDIRSWGRRLAVTAGFIAVMYALFAQLLQVYTPREVLF